MPVSETTLAQAAMIVREAAPEAWQHFVMALSQYAGGVANDMVDCPPDNLRLAQGRAQMAVRIAKILHDAPQVVQKVKDLNHGRPARPQSPFA